MPEITLDYALDTVQQLPSDQQEMLLGIMHSRHIARRHREIAQNAQESLDIFWAGKLKPSAIKEVVEKLALEFRIVR
ncbi:MAG TPA: hypothetical protein VI451_05565 [Anaerolineales bacterium]|nr:hypothetical protein [Anaerolineales bacterium]